jgi:hypothetical protein
LRDAVQHERCVTQKVGLRFGKDSLINRRSKAVLG